MHATKLTALYWLVYIGNSICAGGEPPPDTRSKAVEWVRQAFHYECEGNADLRNLNLRAALIASPDYAPANWQSGRVRDGDTWRSLGEMHQRESRDATVAKYRELRTQAIGDVDRQLDLARWCARVGFPDRARLHYAKVLATPAARAKARQEVIKKLNLRNVNGIWLTKEQFQEQQDSAERTKRALNTWYPRLSRLRRPFLHDRAAAAREHAISMLQNFDDPQVIAAAGSFLWQSGEPFGHQLCALLGRFPDHAATQELARFALLAPWPSVREAACLQLKKRPVHDYVPILLNCLVASVKSQWRIVPQPDGTIKYDHVIKREDQGQITVSRVDRLDASGIIRSSFQLRTGIPDISPPSPLMQSIAVDRMLREALPREVEVARFNLAVASRMQFAFAALERTTGKILPRDANTWWEWWEEYNELHVPEKPYSHSYIYSYAPPTKMSCFVAGTPVWTEIGMIPIEKVLPGDRVLSQQPVTGELAFKLVLQTTIRPPAALLRLRVEGEDILTTKGHPMWVVNKGWQMAKRLNAGDYLHGVTGPLLVEDVELLKREQPAHNLVVADFATYFVGDAATLVHDNSYRKPTRALVPGFIPASNSVAAPKKPKG